MRPRCSYRTIDELWTHSCGGIQPLTWSRRLITAHAPPFCFRRFTSNPSTHHKNIAVIGAGVTGLSTAFRLSQDQDARVTLYEQAPKLGGWLQSEIINVDGGEVLFEYGPRTLRAGLGGSLSTLELLFDLGLKDDILPTETDSPAARNRYIYYPDHLVRLPGPYPGAGVLGNILMNVMQLFSEPLLWKLALEVILEPRRPVRDRSISDESIGDFMKRRFGPNVADVVASAFFHGIYAGDLYKLSARSILRIAWDEFELSERGFATELMDQFNQQKILMPYDIAMARRLVEKEKYKEIRRFATGNNVLTLRRGMGQLATALESSLRGASNVEIKTDSSAGQDTAEGTKLTVILGGHWWDDWLLSDLPDEENAIAMAKSVLLRHLRIADEPVVARARLQRDAIPQPTVGQVTQMERLHDALERRFEGRLKVAGAWYTGVGVNDSIRAGRIVAAATLEGQEGVTGLERYTPENFKRRFGGSRVQEGRE
ncbi:protoporphyrinogen oxidase [Histoplasma capsulatum H143]|uniref:Protoporphyrinogen oxidase n=1 Tax=Ajellomyces capsulatus (strain H143) TaxID=544712 RepID=C6HDR0_AJECH|nr:protoporphyrinogen oxidase [Histoplasma capsulatum H143]